MRSATTVHHSRVVCCMIACLCASSCHRVPDKAPPRATDTVDIPPQTSVIDVPISGSLSEVAAALNKAVPPRLWTIDKAGQTCLASKKVKVLFARIKTPTITCRIVGAVTRGPMTISGQGRQLTVVMPLHATVSARDIGHVLGGETAVGEARVRADVTLDVGRDWVPRGTVKIRYDWTDEPHVDFLGQRIAFTGKADAKLASVIAKLERSLPQELAKLDVRSKAEQAWKAAFTSLQVNRANPPVWIRIAPQALSYSGYAVEGRTLTLRIGMTAQTQTFIGPRPADPSLTPLPALDRNAQQTSRIVFALPVIAAYDQLEPVLAKALVKRSRRPFVVPGIGPVQAQFGKITAYGTPGGRIAVGMAFTATPSSGTPSHGTVWLTARPVNEPNSRQISFSDPTVSGVTDSSGADLLIRVANAPGLSSTISDALTQNFSKDYQQLLAKVSQAIAVKRAGDLVIRARIDDVQTGRIKAFGQGVYLAVQGQGKANVTLERGTSTSGGS